MRTLELKPAVALLGRREKEALTFPAYAKIAGDLLLSIPEEELEPVLGILQQAYAGHRQAFICGNGGSSSNASHFAQDLSSLLLDSTSGRRFLVRCLNESVPSLTAVSNDYGYDQVFKVLLQANASPGDVLICISGSGQSPNILRATEWANEHGLRTIGICGYDGGHLLTTAEACVLVPCHNMGLLEGVHALLLDFIGKELRYRIYGVPHGTR